MSSGDNLITASKLLGVKVVDIQGKKIGLLVNIIFSIDPEILDAKALIFPDKMKRWLSRLTDYLKDTTLDYIKDHFPEDYPKITKDIAEKGFEQAFVKWEKYLKNKEEESMKTYYLIPILDLESPSKDKLSKIEIKKSLSECNEYLNREPRKGEDYPFFQNRSFNGLESLLPTTLNLVYLEGLKTKHLKNKRGRLDDLQLYFEGGTVEKLIVQTFGKGARKYFVNAMDFQFSELALKKRDSPINS